MESLKSFFSKCKRVWHTLKKPTKEEFEKFVINNKYDLNKVKIITAITLLNMSPLHHYPFNFLVYYLGKNLLYKTLGEKNVSK